MSATLRTSADSPAQAGISPTRCWTSSARRATARLVAASLLAGVCLLVVSARPAAAETLSAARQHEILTAALAAYDRAVDVSRSDPTAAAAEYRAAAAGFQSLCDAGVHNAALEYNLGNASFRLGDVGAAILHYRRAARLDPRNERLAANLRYVRDRVEPFIAPSGGQRFWQQLVFWHRFTTPAERGALIALASVAGWGLLLAWLRWRRGLLFIAAIVALAVGLAGGAASAVQLLGDARTPPAVVMHGPVELRKGRGAGADPALKQPLGAGVELRILQQRGQWAEVRLPNDDAGWLPVDAIERV